MSEQQELEQFVGRALAQGQSRADIAAVLAEAGWPPEHVAVAMHRYAEVDFPLPVPRPRAQLSAREAFLYLVLFATLYLWAYHLADLLFELIEQFIAPATDNALYRRSSRDMTNSVASILIALPVFIWLSHRLSADLHRHPIKRLSPVRRWLTYLTLFIAAMVVLADLIILISRVLNGDMTTPLLLKCAVVLAIAGPIFGWYLWDLRHEEQEP
ncbi:DUF5671 domain-containing protein [Pseudoxanthomonas dokdonensis]|uniref:DUF5671 domain-containing protein n=1 Tax=Pseudoxanthomonas dokdonensis TaxID=344882 RepID=A0A0R0CJZ0_9GAMM|nr:DUF5671 domain-containing protein [Pseudoxanthomonas dokdonensis]KRG70207.1 hypothetical protein ABB29_07650 [Pseudoxanthomonas dokdonensis]